MLHQVARTAYTDEVERRRKAEAGGGTTNIHHHRPGIKQTANLRMVYMALFVRSQQKWSTPRFAGNPGK